MLLSVDEAWERLRGAVGRAPVEPVTLMAAAGRVLREPVSTPRPIPAFDRVMMDGAALSRQAWAGGRRRFACLGTLHAGEPPPALEDPASCWKVMTGAPGPVGADLVVPREFLEWEGDTAVVDAAFAPPPHGHLHPRGSDAAAGAVLLEAGTRLTAVGLGLAATGNQPTLQVSRKPRVALVSTGDELVEPGGRLADHQLPRSNSFALTGLLAGRAELESIHLPDDPAVLSSRLRELLEQVDFLVCSGGVSRGERDFLPAVLPRLGVERLFHGVAQRPGKPLWAGRHQISGGLVLALPGNPVSTLVSARRYLCPLLDLWEQAPSPPPERVTLAEPFVFDPPLTLFLPVRKDGSRASPSPGRNSGDFVALRGSDGFVALPADRRDFPAGFAAPFFSW